MDHTEERYDPDGDVSRFLASPDRSSGLLLSPSPLLSHEVNGPMLSSSPLLSQEMNDPMLSPLPQAVHHTQAIECLQVFPQPFDHELQQFPQEPFHQAPPLLPQEGFQQAQLISPLEMVQQVPEILPQETPQQNEGFDGLSSVPAVGHMENQVMMEPLNVEGIIIAAMEGIRLEGSSSSNPRNDSMYEPIFHHYLPGHRDCSECVPLRIVSHTSPTQNLFFIVHGGVGTFDHAVFDIEYFGDGTSSTRDRLYVDLSTRSHNWVKSFILGFTTLLQTDTSGTVHDSVSTFNDTLCANMNSSAVDETFSMDLGSLYQEFPELRVGEERYENRDPTFDLSVFPAPTAMGHNPRPFILFGTVIIPAMPEPQCGSSNGSSDNPNGVVSAIPEIQQPALPTGPAESTEPANVARRRRRRRRRSSGPSHLAIQRRRTSRMGLPDVAAYMHLPIEEAAKKLKMCSTALKKVCRKNGIDKWPSRQIGALNRRIEKLDEELVERAQTCVGLFATREQMDKCQWEKILIYKKLFIEWKAFCARRANGEIGNVNDSGDDTSDDDGGNENENENGNDNRDA